MSLNSELFNLILGDNVSVLETFDSDSIDLVVTSPPYDNLRNYSNTLKWNFNSFKLLSKELHRVIRPHGIIVWIVNDATIKGSETGTSFKQALYFKEIGFNLHDTMIYKKQNPIPQIFRNRYNNEFEYMFIFSKDSVTTCNPIKIPCKHAGLKLNGTTYKNYSANDNNDRVKLASDVKDFKIKGNVWEYVVGKLKIDQGGKFHPATFPYQLAYDHIISWSNVGDTVLDPFMGSGTVGLACNDLNRKFIGIELVESYFNQAEKRIDNYVNKKGGL